MSTSVLGAVEQMLLAPSPVAAPASAAAAWRGWEGNCKDRGVRGVTGPGGPAREVEDAWVGFMGVISFLTRGDCRCEERGVRGDMFRRHSSCSLRSRSIASFHALTPCEMVPTVRPNDSALS